MWGRHWNETLGKRMYSLSLNHSHTPHLLIHPLTHSLTNSFFSFFSIFRHNIEVQIEEHFRDKLAASGISGSPSPTNLAHRRQSDGGDSLLGLGLGDGTESELVGGGNAAGGRPQGPAGLARPVGVKGTASTGGATASAATTTASAGPAAPSTSGGVGGGGAAGAAAAGGRAVDDKDPRSRLASEGGGLHVLFFVFNCWLCMRGLTHIYEFSPQTSKTKRISSV